MTVIARDSLGNASTGGGETVVVTITVGSPNDTVTVAVLDNGVVACAYGRPGFHVAFSTDNGHTWRDRISFSHRGEPIILGQEIVFGRAIGVC